MLRIGIDLGGTKVEVVALDAAGAVRLRRRVADARATTTAPSPPSPAWSRGREAELGDARQPSASASPAARTRARGLVRGANSTWLNGRPLGADLAARLAGPVRLANDANCLAMSEAADGAGAGFGVVFAVILGTGVGGGHRRAGAAARRAATASPANGATTRCPG